MDKKPAIIWADNKLAEPGVESDGCTLAPDYNFRKCCERHDVMIRFNQGITDAEADRYLRECIVEHGHPKKALLYWVFSRLSSLLGGWQNVVALILGTVSIGLLVAFG
jgi:hypothetical protein